MDCVRLGIRNYDRLLHHAKGSISAGTEDRLGRRGLDHVAGEHQLDRQQILEQSQRRVGLAELSGAAV